MVARSKYHRGTTMNNYAAIYVSLEASVVCVLDEDGAVVAEVKLASEPEALIAFFGAQPEAPCRIGLEAGPLSQWLYAELLTAGLPAVLKETRQVHDAFRSSPMKTDRRNARGLAQLVRMGWFMPVYCKSVAAQESRALLAARRQLQAKCHDIEMSIRSLLRGFGLKVGKTTARRFTGVVRELTEGRPALIAAVEALLSALETLARVFSGLDRRVQLIARADPRTRLLMSAQGVGAVVALTYVSAIDEPGRIARSRSAGAYFGLTQRTYQYGETDRTGRISKCGDREVRVALYEAANLILTQPIKGSALKSWAMRLAKRAGMRKAKVALARKLAVVLHRMWRDATPFDITKGAAMAS